MNDILANIFGLHLGVEIYCVDDTGYETTGKLVAVRNGVKEYSVRIKYTEFNEGRWYKLKDCKILLTPLSEITEKDKIIFQSIFRCKNNQRVSSLKVNGVFLEIEIFTGYSQTFDKRTVQATPKELMWLCLKGYDCGVVPDEYKIVRSK